MSRRQRTGRTLVPGTVRFLHVEWGFRTERLAALGQELRNYPDRVFVWAFLTESELRIPT